MKNKAIVHGVSGDQARASGILRALWPLLIALPLFGCFVGLLLPQFPVDFVASGFIAIAIFLFLSIKKGLHSLDSYFKGAHGEDRVAFLLAALPGGYHVFNDLPCGHFSMDHVVVGESGLFSIETKCWAGKVTLEENEIFLDGKKPSRSPIMQAQASAFSLDSYLSEQMESAPQSQPVLCFASETFDSGLTKSGRVQICNASDLLSFLREDHTHLSTQEIEQIVKVLEQENE